MHRVQQNGRGDVAFGSKADSGARPVNVCFTPINASAL
jgi:hypothetical protein